MTKELLIIYVKNPELGKVKTRLAKSVGDEKALFIYKKLLWQTHQKVKNIRQDKFVAYSSYIDRKDIWENHKFEKILQSGNDLGSKMHASFMEGFKKNYNSICLIGTDIMELNPSIIDLAFRQLLDHDLVLGPALDGGYYLIGMKHPQPELFDDIPWSSNLVLEKTKKKALANNLSLALLPTLNDIDDIDDIRNEDKDFLLP